MQSIDTDCQVLLQIESIKPGFGGEVQDISNTRRFRVRNLAFFVTGTEQREDDMIEKKRDIPSPPYDQLPVNEKNMTISHAALLADMEQVFMEARPRLLRLAHLNGLSPDM